MYPVCFATLASLLPAQSVPSVSPETTTPATQTAEEKARALRLESERSSTVASATATTADEAVIELSPFQVDSSKENGYYAANTLSGTRLNSKVQDLGGSITVITMQQLEDTASVDINDIFKFESNTEGTSNYTAINLSTPTSDNLQTSSAASNTRVRGIGSPNVTVDYFTHTTRIPIDTYNIESAEISRGPNSTVAGLGSPAGTINTNLATANVTRATNQVTFRVDDLGGYRSTFNINRPLWKDKIALRIAGLYSNKEFNQKPSYDLTRRIYGAMTIKPFRDTTIRLKAESYREDRQTPNSLTPRDGVTEWLENGKPTWNPLTFTYTVNGVTSAPVPVGSGTTAELLVLPKGLYVNSTTYTRPSMYIDNGAVQYWSVNRRGTSANPNASTTSNIRMISSGSAYMRGTVNAATLYQVPGISNKALYDWENVNAVATNWNYDKAAMYTAEFEQKIVENLFFRAAWHLEDSVNYNRNVTAPTLVMDVNQTLLNGTTNPYFLRPYISAIEPSIFRSPEYNDAIQATLTYAYDFSRLTKWVSWLGKHQLGGNYESRNVTTGTFRYREAIIDPNHVWLTPGSLNYTNGAAVGRPTYQYYVGPTGALGYTEGYTPPKSGVEGTYNLNWYNGTTGQWVSESAKFGTATYLSSRTRSETRTRSLTWQGNMLRNRVVVTSGYRKDAYRTRNSATSAVDGASGYYTYDALNTWNAWTVANGPTKMNSIVVYPFKSRWLGLTYSQSNSFQPQAQAVDLFGNILPNTYGKGRDIGFFANLLDDKLVFSVKVYKTNITDDRTSNSTLGTRIARIEAGGYLPGTSSDTFSLYNFAQNVARGRLGATAEQTAIDAEAAKILQWSDGFKSAVAANIGGSAIRGTADTSAKGAEAELSYNPTYNWNLKFSVTRTEAMNEKIESNLADYINSRMNYWTSVKDDAGNFWWTSSALSSQSAKAFYDSAVVIPLKIGQALLGKSNPQVKKYSARLLTTYRFTEGRFKNFEIGGSARWDDRSVVGYLGGAADADGIVRTLDVDKGYYDPARYQFDFWGSYSFKFANDKIRGKVQLNLANAFEGGGLRVVGVNPDGQPYNYRIISPRQLSLTTKFDF